MFLTFHVWLQQLLLNQHDVSCLCVVKIVDAVVIFSSFAIDIVFLGGVTGEEGQKAVAVLVVLLLWRIARVVDG